VACGRSVRLVTSAATGKHRRASAFTLVEVLAAMLFMAMVIPAVVSALQVSSLSGEFATRKAEAARVADRALNENLALSNGGSLSGLNGTVVENGHEFRWTINSQPWSADSTMQLVTAEVSFTAAGREYSVRLNTLVNPLAQQQQSTSTTTGMQ
jgi:type II secretory pathway pseudopilin PulG